MWFTFYKRNSNFYNFFFSFDWSLVASKLNIWWKLECTLNRNDIEREFRRNEELVNGTRNKKRVKTIWNSNWKIHLFFWNSNSLVSWFQQMKYSFNLSPLSIISSAWLNLKCWHWNEREKEREIQWSNWFRLTVEWVFPKIKTVKRW